MLFCTCLTRDTCWALIWLQNVMLKWTPERHAEVEELSSSINQPHKLNHPLLSPRMLFAQITLTARLQPGRWNNRIRPFIAWSRNESSACWSFGCLVGTCGQICRNWRRRSLVWWHEAQRLRETFQHLVSFTQSFAIPWAQRQLRSLSTLRQTTYSL